MTLSSDIIIIYDEKSRKKNEKDITDVFERVKRKRISAGENKEFFLKKEENNNMIPKDIKKKKNYKGMIRAEEILFNNKKKFSKKKILEGKLPKKNISDGKLREKSIQEDLLLEKGAQAGLLAEKGVLDDVLEKNNVPEDLPKDKSSKKRAKDEKKNCEKTLSPKFLSEKKLTDKDFSKSTNIIDDSSNSSALTGNTNDLNKKNIQKREKSNDSLSLIDIPFVIGGDNLTRNSQYLRKFSNDKISKNDKKKYKRKGKGTKMDDPNNNYGPNKDMSSSEDVAEIEKKLPSLEEPMELAFVPYQFIFPIIIRKKMFGELRTLNCSFAETSFVRMKSLVNQVVRLFPVLDCKKGKLLSGLLEFKSYNLIFLYRFKEYESILRKEDKKEYLESLSNGTPFSRNNKLEEERLEIFQFQIENKVNFFYIENGEDLTFALKRIILFKETSYVPKVKKFSDDREGFLINMLKTIPGISKNVSTAIAKKFGRLEDIIKCKDFSGIRVFDDDGKKFRVVGKKQSDLIVNMLKKETK